MRRGFGTLLTVAIVAACVTPAASQQNPEIEKGYIRPKIAPLEMPPVRGERYQDTVPDTLDLAEMAELAINGLTGPNDPQAGYELYFTVHLQRNPPIMLHDFSDGNQTKFLGPLALMRVITGSQRHRTEERGMLEAYLKSIGHDGLYYPPLKGRPWFRENMWPEVRGKEPDPKTLPPYEGGRMNPRLLEAVMIYWLRDKNPMWKDLADKMVQNGVGGGLKRFVESTNEWGVAPGTPDSAVPKGFLACDAWTPQALAQYYRLTGQELVKQAARKMVNRQKDHIGYFDPSGPFILNAPGMAPAHFHAHSLSVLGFLEYALAVGDRDLMEYCRRSYEWARTQGSPLIGFFPENIQPNFPNSEGCCAADMVAWSLKLSASGAGDYWDDADRWLRNCFAEFQLTPEKAEQLARAALAMPVQPVRYNETAERVLERSVGAFAGWPGVNEWVHRIGIQHCCTGNCTRTIYYAWGKRAPLPRRLPARESALESGFGLGRCPQLSPLSGPSRSENQEPLQDRSYPTSGMDSLRQRQGGVHRGRQGASFPLGRPLRQRGKRRRRRDRCAEFPDLRANGPRAGRRGRLHVHNQGEHGGCGRSAGERLPPIPP